MTSKPATIGDLLDLAVALERAAEEAYRGFEAKFAHHPPVAAFWKAYAEEEVGHARWLERIRAQTSLEKLAQPADPQLVEAARRLLRTSVSDSLQDIQNLEQAYQMANEWESSEINTILGFMIDHFAVTKDSQSFLRAQLGEHVARLMNEFPTQFRGKEIRLSTKALT